MCGIFGLVGPWHLDRTKAIKRMSELLRHRGPDDFGCWIGEGAAIGMNRLSIIDVTGGSQPIWNEPESALVVMNGEIYDYRALRETLVAKGHTFRTSSDTEVLIHLYEQMGPGSADQLVGMFAYAIWDVNERRLVLSRDRLGIKPLYYAYCGDGRLAFSSEAKALLELPGMSRNLSAESVALFEALHYIPEPLTVWSEVRKLEPGHFLEWRAGKIRNETYWSLSHVVHQRRCGSLSFEDARDELRDLATQIVKDHLVSDVPIATLLSSGTDSTLITALASKAQPGISAFTMAMTGDADESEVAKRTAGKLMVRHHVEKVSIDLFDKLPDLLWYQDEPFADNSVFPTYAMSQVVSRSHKVALSGDGGDELFGGYNYYRMFPMIERISGVPDRVRRVAGQVLRCLPRASVAFLARSLGICGSMSLNRSVEFMRDPSLWSAWGSYRFAKEWMRPQVGLELSPSSYLDIGDFIAARAKELGVDTSDNGALLGFCALDLSLGLPGDMLAKVDRMSMANSLEVRVPFCDHRLVEWSVGLPDGVRVKGMIGKRLLREAFQEVLPLEVLKGGKRGFVVPLGDWLERHKEQVMRILLSRNSHVREWMDVSSLARFCKKDLVRNPGEMNAVWTALVLEVWHEVFCGRTCDRPTWTLSDLADARG